MNNFQPWLSGLATILHGVNSPQQANQDRGFLSRYMGTTGNPLTSPTPTKDQSGILQAAAEALHGNPQPGSLAAGISSLMSKSPMGPSQGFSGSATAPVPDTSSFSGGSQPTESPLVVRGIRPQPQAPVAPPQAPAQMPPQVPQQVAQGPVQGPPEPMQGAPLPPPRPDDQALFQPRTDAPDPHGPIGSTPTMWGANFHGPENSLFNRLGASGSSPGDGLKSFADSGAMDNFKGQSQPGPNLLSFLNMFG